MEELELTRRVGSEIEALHQFFVAWLTGAVPRDNALFQQELGERLSSEFTLIDPESRRFGATELLASLWDGYGRNPDFRIQIRNAEVRARGGCLWGTYQEWQKGARTTRSANTGRLASFVLARRPAGFRWLLVHESWLPTDLVADEAFSF